MFAGIAAVLGSSSLPDGDISTSTFKQVVVIPDVHGDDYALTRSLWLAHKRIDGADEVPKFIDFYYILEKATHRDFPEKPISRAAPGTVALVQLGDVLDRGPESLKCVKIMWVVERLFGWRVLSLYGNHEIMNMAGTMPLDQIHKTELMGGLPNRKTLFMRGRIMHNFLMTNYLAMARLSSGSDEDSYVLDSASNPNTLFVHGGIDLSWLSATRLTSSASMVDINNYFARHVSSESHLARLSEERSIFWTRMISQGPEEDVCETLIDEILSHFKVARIIVGHSSQDDMTVKTRCDGKVVLADVKMSRWMTNKDQHRNDASGGRPVAIVMTMTERGSLQSIVAHYTDLATGTVDEHTDILIVE